MSWRDQLADFLVGGHDTDERRERERLAQLKQAAESDSKRVSADDEAEFRAFSRRCPQRFLDARERYVRWRRRDPYQDIEPGLLNCADFCDYIAATGMFYPFTIEQHDIQRASCDMRLLGRVIYWDAEGTKQDFVLSKNTAFTLERNSIAFVTLEPYLQIPDYIALRFNLKIKKVYLGLLLGTGPLVDPGYQGKLAIPLQNLTDNDYVLQGGEPLITVEFTKIKDNRVPDADAASLEGQAYLKPRSRLYRPFDDPKVPHFADTDRTVNYQLDRARLSQGASRVQSSLSPTLEKAREALESARRQTNAAFWATLVTTLFAVGSLVATVVAFFSFTGDAKREIKDDATLSRSESAALVRRIDSLQRCARALAEMQQGSGASRQSISAGLQQCPRR